MRLVCTSAAATRYSAILTLYTRCYSRRYEGEILIRDRGNWQNIETLAFAIHPWPCLAFLIFLQVLKTGLLVTLPEALSSSSSPRPLCVHQVKDWHSRGLESISQHRSGTHNILWLTACPIRESNGRMSATSNCVGWGQPLPHLTSVERSLTSTDLQEVLTMWHIEPNP
jgi:hypothetical protein